uniref:Uncharacterized protein n=1 Tax=Anguilla anguilla TaxID=7936 RepID=A0A0E9UJI4_ANGAN
MRSEIINSTLTVLIHLSTENTGARCYLLELH